MIGAHLLNPSSETPAPAVADGTVAADASTASDPSAPDPLALAANMYRVTINRLAIEVRTADNPEYDDDIGMKLTAETWHPGAENIIDYIDQSLDLRDRNQLDLATHLALVVNPYNRPDMSEVNRNRWRDLDLALENAGAQIEWDKPPSTLLPLLEFYGGLVRIDRKVAKFYDASRYERLMVWMLGLGGVLLVLAVITAAATGFKDFDWSKVPKEGSLGVFCGFLLGILLDIRRRYKTRKMVEEWGEKFGCDLRELRWRRLPKFVERVRREIRRLGGEEFAKMEADALEPAIKALMEERGYRNRIG